MGLVRSTRARPISFACASSMAALAVPPPPPLRSVAGLRSRALRLGVVAAGVIFTWSAQKGFRALIDLI
jgi:hypothetical protein